MIEDVLRDNPGMLETYRAYGREMYVRSKLEDARVRHEKLLSSNASVDEVKKVEDEIQQREITLKNAICEIEQCKEKEKVLRSQMELEVSNK